MNKRQKRLDTLVERYKDAELKFMGEPVTDLTRIEILAVLAERIGWEEPLQSGITENEKDARKDVFFKDWNAKNKGKVGEGYEQCHWDEAEEYTVHLGSTPVDASDKWRPMSKNIDRPLRASGHRFYYRRKIKENNDK
jgi:DNA-binding transcriptional ArsR family regulator